MTNNFEQYSSKEEAYQAGYKNGQMVGALKAAEWITGKIASMKKEEEK